MQLLDWGRAGASVVLGVVGQLMFRRFGMGLAESGWVPGLLWPLDVQPQALEALLHGAGWLLTGTLCYLFAVLMWVRVLQQLTLARAYPLLSLGYPLVYLGAVVWLGEAATLPRTLGTALVCVGVLLAVAPARQVKAPSE